MAPIRYHYTGDEDQLPVTPPPSLNLDEDSDSWWAGVQQCFVAVPIAGTLAAIALSASLAFGYQQQTEDIVPYSGPALTVDEDYGPRTVIIESPHLVQLWVSDGAASAPAPAFVPDEDFWQFPAVRLQIQPPQVWAVDDELPVSAAAEIAEEEYWQVYTPPYPLLHFPYLPDPEELLVVPPPAFVLDEDYWLRPSFGLPKRKISYWITGDAAVPIQIEEEYWWRAVWLRPHYHRLGPPWDDQVPAGSLLVFGGAPDEDFWQVYTPPYPPFRFLYLPEPEEVPSGSLRGTVEEDYWQVYTAPRPPVRFVYLPDPEELPAGSLVAPIPSQGSHIPTFRRRRR